ncbi:MAG: SPFH domain-containing protein [Anaerolineales bacterium]
MLDTLLNGVTIAAWVFFGIYLILVGIRGYQIGGAREAGREIVSPRSLLVFMVLLILSLLNASLVFVEPPQVGVVISLFSRDGYREQPMRSGLHFIVPLAERVERYPIYWQTYTMSTEPLEGDKVGDDSIAARTSDGQLVYLDSSVIYRIDANEVVRLHIDLQSRYVDDFIRPVIRGLVRTEVSQFTADEVNSSRRKNLEANLDEQLRAAFSEKGIILDRFLLRNVAFSPEYTNAIEAKQVAEQERTQREYQAEQMRQLAQGERDKLKIEAEGRAQATVLEGQADAQVILLKAEAQSEALRLINEILQQNRDLITYQYVDKLGPGVQVMLVPNDNPYLLPLPEMLGPEVPSAQPTATPEAGIGDTGTMTETLTVPEIPIPTLPPVELVTPTPTPTP